MRTSSVSRSSISIFSFRLIRPESKHPRNSSKFLAKSSVKDHNKIERYYCIGRQYIPSDVHIEYTLDIGGRGPQTIQVVTDDLGMRCHIHGIGCCGHIESDGTNLFMPTTLTKSTIDRKHVLMESTIIVG